VRPARILLVEDNPSDVGATDDAVAAARYLLSDGARYVTGTNVHVSGGWGL
jgi:3-oxoacyl-[acyl-carrier protein] reductase